MSLQERGILQKLDDWLHMLIEVEGADLHIKSNSKIHARVKSEIVLLSHEIVDAESLEKLVKALMGNAYAEME